MPNRIWVDVEDLFKYAGFGFRPSGIQRLEFELCCALNALPQSKERVFFVRHDVEQQYLVTVPWEAVEIMYTSMTSGSPAELKGTSLGARARSVLKEAARALSPGLHKVAVLQIEVFISLTRLIRTRVAPAARLLKRRRRLRNGRVIPSRELMDHFTTTAEPGDILAVFGAAWAVSDFTSCIERVTHEKGLRLALLIYDIIPLRRAEWFVERLANDFRTWFDCTLPLADIVLTISAATARDVTQYAQRTNLALRAAPTPIPIGTGFKKNDASRPPASHQLSSRLPPANSYVLVVSTIEARKNHLLLFRVWRRLLEDMPAESVPTLVFAGQVGWLVSNLMEQLHTLKFLDGKIIHVDSPTDQELEALYVGCLFTLFPSFYEGWGLPVTESHSFGRPCVVSNTSSLPEAGGSLARYIDPESTTDAYRVIRQTIEDRAGLRAWRDRVRREFKPVEWSQSARAVLKALDTTKNAPTDQELEARLPDRGQLVTGVPMNRHDGAVRTAGFVLDRRTDAAAR
jgi:glycosyltransferase involved in cell wall biosynthesis